jgi:dihydrofolate synthase/folylpolyglutamate synthase
MRGDVACNLHYYFPDKKKIILLGVLADKDYTGLADVLSTARRRFYSREPGSPRALPARELSEHLKKYGKSVTCCDTIENGVKAAVDMAGKGGVACAVGSLYMAGRVRACFGL